MVAETYGVVVNLQVPDYLVDNGRTWREDPMPNVR